MLFKLVSGLLILFLSFLSIKTFSRARNRRPLTSNRLGKYERLRSYIEAQARHETGNYRSKAYLEENNLFGMKNAVKRDQLGTISDRSDYRKYSHPEESIKDLIKYFEFVNFPKSVPNAEQYVQELKNRNYFEDSYSNYLNGVKFHLNDIKKQTA